MFPMFQKKIGIDLGTANSLVYVEGKEIIINEPTVVAISIDDRKVLAVGNKAKEMLGKVPENIIARRPLQDGVIASFKLTQALLKYFIETALGSARLFRPEVMISVPAGVTTVEERAVIEAAVSAGAGKVYLIPEPIAAAIGAKLPISSSAGNMIVNMGGGTSEIAIISLNGIVAFNSERVGGDAINSAIVSYVRKHHGLLIGEQMSEQIKIKIGSAIHMDNPLSMQIKGRDVASGLPSSTTMESNEVADAIRPALNQIITAIKKVLEQTPPELASDVIDRGMVLSGGTSLIRDLDELFTKATGVSAYTVDEPLFCVIRGIAEAISHIDVVRRSLKGR